MSIFNCGSLQPRAESAKLGINFLSLPPILILSTLFQCFNFATKKTNRSAQSNNLQAVDRAFAVVNGAGRETPAHRQLHR
jgi:hypothetical protein